MGSISLNIRLDRFKMKLLVFLVILMVATNEGCIAGVFDPNPEAYDLPESISIIARNENCEDALGATKCKEKKEGGKCETNKENMKTKCALTCGFCNETITTPSPITTTFSNITTKNPNATDVTTTTQLNTTTTATTPAVTTPNDCQDDPDANCKQKELDKK